MSDNHVYQVQTVPRLIRENIIYHEFIPLKRENQFEIGAWETVVHKKNEDQVRVRVVSRTRLLDGSVEVDVGEYVKAVCRIQ